MREAAPAPCCRFAAVILGAGRSTRMGRPKLLLPWGGTSIIGHLLAQWNALGASSTAVVCAANDTALESELDRLGFPAHNRVYNPAPDRGMFSSIQCAAVWDGWRQDTTHWAILLGDQPHLHQRTLRALLDFAAANPETICQPTTNGRRGHPVVLPRSAFAQLGTTTAANLKEFLATHEIRACEVDDPGLHQDLDYPEDYQRALDRAKGVF